MLFYAALYAAKFARFILRVFGRNATEFPGAVALKIDPDFLRHVNKGEKVIAVTGTNGKTTVTNLITDILKADGQRVAANALGSNMKQGICSAFIANSDLKGNPNFDVAVLEVDERSSRFILKDLNPDYMVVLNLSRDTIKRNANVDFIFDILNESIPKSTKIILNADDPISMRLAPGNVRVYAGVADGVGEISDKPNIIRDLIYCPECGAPLIYNHRRYHHIGRVHCNRCDFKSAAPDYLFTKEEDGRATIATPAGTINVHLKGNTLPDMYNQTQVVALLSEMGWSTEKIRSIMDGVSRVRSRYYDCEIGGKKIIQRIAKGENGVSVSRILCSIRRDPSPNKAVVITLDDARTINDSENICWLYETDFEYLKNDSVKQIIVGGIRSEDYRLRLLMAGIPAEKISITRDEKDAIKLVNLDMCDTIYHLFDPTNYAYLEDLSLNYLKNRLEGERAA